MQEVVKCIGKEPEPRTVIPGGITGQSHCSQPALFRICAPSSASGKDHLVIAKEKKDIILALTESRTGQYSGPEFDDVVVGKGRGLIVLLQ